MIGPAFSNGATNPNDFVARMLRGLERMHAVPGSTGHYVHTIPVDVCARVAVALGESNDSIGMALNYDGRSSCGTWCSSTKRENFNHICEVLRLSLTSSRSILIISLKYHEDNFECRLYHSLTSLNITKHFTRASRSNTGTRKRLDFETLVRGVERYLGEKIRKWSYHTWCEEIHHDEANPLHSIWNRDTRSFPKFDRRVVYSQEAHEVICDALSL